MANCEKEDGAAGMTTRPAGPRRELQNRKKIWLAWLGGPRFKSVHSDQQESPQQRAFFIVG